MNRRDFLKVTGTAAAMSTSHGALAKTQADRPNLLVIHTDEQNFRTLGCYRKLSEVAGWTKLSPEAREAVMAELPSRRALIRPEKLAMF